MLTAGLGNTVMSLFPVLTRERSQWISPSYALWFLLPQIMDRALFHMDNTYKIPNIRGTGRICKTNLPSNTAFRGFGGPQGMLIAEHWMSEVAVTCGLPAEEVSWPNSLSLVLAAGLWW